MTRALCIIALVALGGACEPTYPGEPVGAWDVVGQLEENGCGAGMPAVSTMRFAVEIRDDDGQSLWRREGFPMVSGRTTEDGLYVYQLSRHIPLYGADPDSGRGACTLVQQERVAVALVPPGGEDGAVGAVGDATLPPPDAGAAPDGSPAEPPPALEGLNEVSVAPLAGSDCARALAAFGGPFTDLPCRVRYGLAGEARAPF